ncbi:heat shock protein HSP90 family protein [Rhizoctonia solani]|uniref:Heat shock protein HSP90 family protein n=1 Tax=Rhizoctonia solani TaxID=456999 RepID=A0A8H8STK6_9AGAM|nr:heat shock protein HSP90 family protein [Rhizoctonia solani]QRW16407.1 heat shock protein HSP90 family protein [Rhizoctonia solani]
MRFCRTIVLTASVLGSLVSAQDGTSKKFEYQVGCIHVTVVTWSIVINSLYSHKEVFLRELISNANDALEKLRLISLTDKSYQIPDSPLNITIKLVGTLAKSGTSEFLNKAEKDTSGNLIGQFGLGFYSSFLVADKVQVDAVITDTGIGMTADDSPKTLLPRRRQSSGCLSPPVSKANPDPLQHIFTSGSDDSNFEISVDPRGNSLGHSGTEITMYLKDEALEFLDEQRLNRVDFHIAAEPEKTKEAETDEDEAIIEDVKEDDEKKEEPASPPTPMKNVTTEEWQYSSSFREPKDVTKDEVNQFFMSTFKEHNGPLAHSIYKGDSGPVSFRTMFFIPSDLNEKFWQSAKPELNNIRLMVKRVFITSDLGPNAMPKWLSWLKAIVDADDLPLNVSRETLQSNRFLRQIPNILWIRGLQFQDAAKKGLKFGDEDEDAEEEKARQEKLKETFKPLLEYLKNETSNVVLIANMERLMAAQTGGKMKENDFMHDWAKKQKFLEINPNSPLIEGMLKKVQALIDIEEGEERDSQLEEELKEVASILVDGALVRSGFEVPDSNLFFTRMDRVLRRSLGVSETAKGDETVKPAPPVDDTPLEEPGVLPEGAFEDIIDNTADQKTFQPKVDVKVDALNDEEIEEMLNKKEQEVKRDEL